MLIVVIEFVVWKRSSETTKKPNHLKLIGRECLKRAENIRYVELNFSSFLCLKSLNKHLLVGVVKG